MFIRNMCPRYCYNFLIVEEKSCTTEKEILLREQSHLLKLVYKIKNTVLHKELLCIYCKSIYEEIIFIFMFLFVSFTPKIK